MNQVGGLVTADAMAIAFNSDAMAKVLIIGGLCGIITSWNSFLIGGSRALYSMACAHMIPPYFAKLHPKHKTPVNALILLGVITTIAVFFGKKMLLWVVDAGNFGCVLAYFMVSVSFLVLRVKEPDMERPYKVGCGNYGRTHVGIYACHVRSSLVGLGLVSARMGYGIGMDFIRPRFRSILQTSL